MSLKSMFVSSTESPSLSHTCLVEKYGLPLGATLMFRMRIASLYCAEGAQEVRGGVMRRFRVRGDCLREPRIVPEE